MTIRRSRELAPRTPLSRMLYPNTALAALHALAVNDPSLRQDVILCKGNQHARHRLPGPPRGDACAVRAHVLGERPFLRQGFVWVRKLCRQFLRDPPFGSTVESTGWNWRSHDPPRPPGQVKCPKPL